MQRSEQTVIIVGSGVSAAKAAQELSKNEPAVRIVVLEAAAQIGGRTRSVPIKLKDQPAFQFDLGASWIHQSCPSHPITKIMKAAGLETVRTNEDISKVLDAKGKEVPEKEVDKEWKEYEKLLKKLEDGDKDVSVLEGITKKAPQKLQSPLFMHQVSYDIEFQTSAPIRDLSAWEAYGDDEFDGSQMMVVNGYEKVSEYLFKDSRAQVLLGHKVVSVSRKATYSEVECENGAKFKAEKVIVTVPLGALKKEIIKFNPPLPKEKVSAIQNMAMGNVCKVLLEFDKPITKQKMHYFTVLAEDAKDSGLVTFYLNLFALTGKPLIMTFGLGESAGPTQTMPEEKLKSILLRRLQTFSEVPLDENSFRVYRSNWVSNPLFGGAYSYPRVGCSYKEYEALARPVFDCEWYFCGEHTTFRYRASVHGAYLSGMHTAKLLFNQKNWEYFDHKWYLENKD